MTSSERVLVIGTGLIGTSIAMSATRCGDDVRGIDVDTSARSGAAARAAVDVVADPTQLGEWTPTLVVVATPVGAIADTVVGALRRWPEATVTDVGSVKSRIRTEVAADAPDAASRYVGGHPMGGTERTGPEWASPAVLDDVVWVITPDAAADERVRSVEAWVTRLGARPVRMPAERHDRLVATVSHLPQVASTALMNFAATREAGEPEPLLLAAGGFRDLTRLAASNPRLWSEILLGNRDEVVAAIDGFLRELGELRDTVAAGEGSVIEEAFARGKTSRLSLAAKPRVRSGVAVLQVPITDSPGSLARLTAALVGTNIEDLQIVHSGEGGGGIVHLTLALDEAQAARDLLAAAGFGSIRLA